jgi:hypothetical protein
MKAKVFDRPEVNETTATLTENGQLDLNEPLTLAHNSRVRLIVLVTEDETDPGDTPIAEIHKSIYRGWQEALTGHTKPVSQLWQG